jgi:hypothetical protein
MTTRSTHHQKQTESVVHRTLASAAASASVPHTMMRTRAVKTTASAAVFTVGTARPKKLSAGQRKAAVKEVCCHQHVDC